MGRPVPKKGLGSRCGWLIILVLLSAGGLWLYQSREGATRSAGILPQPFSNAGSDSPSILVTDKTESKTSPWVYYTGIAATLTGLVGALWYCNSQQEAAPEASWWQRWFGKSEPESSGWFSWFGNSEPESSGWFSWFGSSRRSRGSNYGSSYRYGRSRRYNDSYDSYRRQRSLGNGIQDLMLGRTCFDSACHMSYNFNDNQ